MTDIYKMKPQEIDVFIQKNQEQSKDEYMKKNRWFITASKLKLFEKSREAFFLKYILEVPLPSDDKEDTDSIELWNAVDYYISNWEM